MTDNKLEINFANVIEIEARQASMLLSFVMHSKVVLEMLELANLTTVFGYQVLLANNEELSNES